MLRRNFLKITLPLAFAGKATATPAIEPELTFGVIADPQYADTEPQWGRFYRNSLTKLADAVADLNTRPLEFVATLGDLIDRDFESFAAVMPIYAKLKVSHFPVCGNHDFEVADEYKGKVLGAIGLEKPYYAVTCKSWRFLFLDGTAPAFGVIPPGMLARRRQRRFWKRVGRRSCLMHRFTTPVSARCRWSGSPPSWRPRKQQGSA